MSRKKITPEDVVNSAHLCLAVYDETPDVTGWEPIGVDDLEVPDGYEPDGRYVNENALAFVRSMEVNGEKTLALAFKGTDKWCFQDWKDNILNINTHYEKMRPLIDALDSYVEDKGIDRVMVMGHSLGGAMAAIYMEEHPDTENGVKYSGVSFGSPGGVFPDEHSDNRLICFRHDLDAVPHVASMRSKIGQNYRWPGRVISIDEGDQTRFKGIFGRVKAHSMKEYVKTIESLATKKIFGLALGVDRDLLMLRSDDPQQNCRMRTDPSREVDKNNIRGHALSDEEAQALDELVDKAHEMDRHLIDAQDDAFSPGP